MGTIFFLWVSECPFSCSLQQNLLLILANMLVVILAPWTFFILWNKSEGKSCVSCVQHNCILTSG